MKIAIKHPSRFSEYLRSHTPLYMIRAHPNSMWRYLRRKAKKNHKCEIEITPYFMMLWMLPNKQRPTKKRHFTVWGEWVSWLMFSFSRPSVVERCSDWDALIRFHDPWQVMNGEKGHLICNWIKHLIWMTEEFLGGVTEVLAFF